MPVDFDCRHGQPYWPVRLPDSLSARASDGPEPTLKRAPILIKNITFRRWGTAPRQVHNQKHKSCPLVIACPGRDVTTTDGLKLTLLNPASMLPVICLQKEYGIQGQNHRAEISQSDNAPDDWERQQLQAFTRGEKKEVWEHRNQSPTQRHISSAMFMEPGCDKRSILIIKQVDMWEPMTPIWN